MVWRGMPPNPGVSSTISSPDAGADQMRAIVTIIVISVCVSSISARVVYETGFENNGTVPPDWTVESYGPGPDWMIGGQPGDWHMRVRYGTGEQDEWLISPILDLSQDEGIHVSFWQIFRTTGTGFAQVRVSVDGGGTWETLVEYDSNHSDIPLIRVAQADGQAQVRFCWRYVANLDFQWDVDDVRILSEVPVDMAILGSRGPTGGDHIIRGRDLTVRLALYNAGTDPAPSSSINFSTTSGSHDASLLGGLAPEESISVNFTVPGNLFASPGSDVLRIVLDAEGDQVSENDTIFIESLIIEDIFPDPAPVLINYDDAVDSTLFADVISQRGIEADYWNRGSGVQSNNLYGLDDWDIVVFCENGFYPSLAEQYAMMRFLDSATSQKRHGLVMSGDNWMLYYANDIVLEDFVEVYLRLTGGSTYPESSPPLYPIPGNTLDIDQIVSTEGSDFDILESHPENPGATIAMTYDEAYTSGAVAAIQTSFYSAVALGLKWSQFPSSPEQITLAGGCLDWLLANHATNETGSVLPDLRIGPNPATDVLYLSMPGAGDSYALTLVDLAGHVVGKWDTLEDRIVRLELPRSLRSGVYCLMGEGSTSRRSVRVVICR